jgi:hypothetical protein
VDLVENEQWRVIQTLVCHCDRMLHYGLIESDFRYNIWSYGHSVERFHFGLFLGGKYSLAYSYRFQTYVSSLSFCAQFTEKNDLERSLD